MPSPATAAPVDDASASAVLVDASSSAPVVDGSAPVELVEPASVPDEVPSDGSDALAVEVPVDDEVDVAPAEVSASLVVSSGLQPGSTRPTKTAGNSAEKRGIAIDPTPERD